MRPGTLRAPVPRQPWPINARVCDDLPPTVRERIDLLGDHRTGLAEIDAIGWTEAEWQRRLSENEPFATIIQREGIAVER